MQYLLMSLLNFITLILDRSSNLSRWFWTKSCPAKCLGLPWELPYSVIWVVNESIDQKKTRADSWRVSLEASSGCDSKPWIALGTHGLSHLNKLFTVILSNSYFYTMVMSLCQLGSNAFVKPRWTEVIMLTASPFFIMPIFLTQKKKRNYSSLTIYSGQTHIGFSELPYYLDIYKPFCHLSKCFSRDWNWSAWSIISSVQT